jgi:glycosyltransferase involved in cell wall biosynthesis
MARVCVVRCHYYRDTRVRREVAGLLDKGHRVELVCLRDRGEPRQERRDGLTIRRLPIRHAVGAGAARLLAEYLAFFVLASIVVSTLHLRRRFALVQVNSVPDVLVFTAMLPRLTGARVLLDLQEPMPEFFATRFGTDARHPMVRLIAALEQLSIRFAHAAITPTEAMRRTFVSRGAPARKITVVMDGADEQVFDVNRHPPRGREPDRFVLVSHGTIEPQYGLDTAIHAVAQLADELPGLQLRIFGDGSQRQDLQALAERLGVGDRVWFSAGFVPVGELVAALADADVGVVAMKRDAFRDLTLAGKMFDLITMGTPMAVSLTRSVQETFEEGCFEPFISGDVADLARAIRRLHDQPDLAAAYASRAAEAGRPYSWHVQRRKYLEVVDALLNAAARSRRGSLSSSDDGG